MRDEHAELWNALAAPFRPDQISHRPGGGGRSLAYITARDVMDRLDDVLGPSNWWDDYEPIEGAVICRLTIRLPDGSTITKTDAGGDCALDDDGDARKGAFSDALKRAAVRFGVGRHLDGGGEGRGRTDVGAAPRGRPRDEASPARRPPADDGRPARLKVEENLADVVDPPRTGRALYGWAKDRGLHTPLERLSRYLGFPDRLVDWPPEQVAQIFTPATYDDLLAFRAPAFKPTRFDRALNRPRDRRPAASAAAY